MAPTDWAAQIMLRLDAEAFGEFLAVQQPGEDRPATLRRLIREAVLPFDTVIEYRMAPLFPQWCRMGPMSPTAAYDRAQPLQRRGFEVRTVQVEPRRPGPAWDDPETDGGEE